MGLISPHSLQHLLFTSYYNHNRRCEVIPHYALICIFLITNHTYVFVGHLYVFIGEMTIQVLCLFVIWVVFLLMNCESLYILFFITLLDIWFPNICSHYVGCLFTLLIIFSDDQKFSILTKLNLPIFLFCCLCFCSHN